MDKKVAIDALQSDEPRTRVQAVRALGALADTRTISLLEAALKVEKTAFLRRLIPASIERIKLSSSHSKPSQLSEASSGDWNDANYQKAVQFVTGVLLHEVSPKVGLLKYSAEKEISDFEASETRHTLDRLDAVIEGITSLRAATRSNVSRTFNVDGFLRQIAHEVGSSHPVPIQFEGSAGLEMQGDMALLSFAFTNGLRNACEATALADPTEPIVVFWGQTDIENYVTILDAGIGVSGPQEAAFEIGKTNKKGHSGFGLAIARMAMTTVLGTANLFPARLGGMRFEMRWPIDG